MNELLALIFRGMIIIGLLATLVVGIHSCFVEDHRHSEEMKRLQLIERGCADSQAEE